MSNGIVHDNIKVCRLKKGLSQSALAEKASINLRTLQRIESGQTAPRGYTLQLIADALEMPLEYFMTDDEQTPLIENQQFAQLLTLSCLSFWIFPFANVFTPLILLHFRKKPVKGIEALGKKIIAFQKRWSLMTYGALSSAILLAIIHPKAMDSLLPLYFMIAVAISCVVNSILIIIRIIQIRHGKTLPGMLAFAFVMCWNEATFAQTTDAQPDSKIQQPPLGRLIDLGGWSLHLYGQGLKNSEGPTVIFENGIRGFSFDWLFVQSKVASFAKAYSYDRAGSAWSDLGPRPHTMQQSVYNLHALLEKARVKPPYIFVGASHGGLLARLFAQAYPDEVSGMVLVDAGYENGIHYINGKKLRPATDATGKPIPAAKKVATTEDNNLAQTPEAVKAIGDALKKIGYPFTHVESPFNKLPDSIQNLRIWALNRFEYYAGNVNDFLFEEKARMVNEREIKPYMLGDIPLIVLTAKQSRESADPDEQERRLNQEAITNLSRNSKQIIATESSHEIHIDQPELVVDAIKQIVEAVNKKTELKK